MPYSAEMQLRRFARTKPMSQHTGWAPWPIQSWARNLSQLFDVTSFPYLSPSTIYTSLHAVRVHLSVYHFAPQIEARCLTFAPGGPGKPCK